MILKVENLSKNYGSKAAVNSVDLEINRGEVYGLLGPNGSGKTTTLGMILGVIQPSRGVIRWFDSTNLALQRKKIGALLEKPNFIPWLSGDANLRMVSSIKGLKSPTKLVQGVLKLTGLEKAASVKFSDYSLGMKQRLAIASTLLGSPDVLVLDEPTNGVDAAGISEIRSLITQMADQGKTIILASHILDEVEKVCSHVGIMANGKILETGSIETVLSTDDHIEVMSTDLTRLQDIISKSPLVKDIKIKENKILAYLKPGIQIFELNEYLVSQRIPVTHLTKKHKSLESHFLELLEK